MKMKAKAVLGAVLMQAALFSAIGAKAEVSIGTGITGYISRPVSVHWMEKPSQAVAGLSGSAAGAAAPEASSTCVKTEELSAAQFPGDGKKALPAQARKEKLTEAAAPAGSPIISGTRTEATVNGAADADGKAESRTSENKEAAPDNLAVGHSGGGKA